MKKRIIFSVLLISFLCLFLSECRRDPPVHKDWPGWKVYTTENSILPDNRISNIALDNHDKKFFLFSQTKKILTHDEQGFVFFDPPSCVYDSIRNGISTGIKFDQNNILWCVPLMGCNGLIAIFKFDGNWQIVDSAEGFRPGGISSFDITNNDTIWCSSTVGLFKYNGSSTVAFNHSNFNIPSDEIIGLKSDIDNSVWFSTVPNPNDITTYAALCHLTTNSNLEIYTSGNSPLTGNGAIVQIESTGVKWFITSVGIDRFFNNQWQHFNSTNTPILSNIIVTDFYIDRNNVKWIATENNGILRYDDNHWSSINIDNSGLPSNKVYSLVVDSHNTVWIGTDKGLASFQQ